MTETTRLPYLDCCCCGSGAGRFKQWRNRDDGYGICRRCVDDEVERGTPTDRIKDLYGVEGVNYQRKEPVAKTGWPPGLLQDDCSGLSKWLSTRLGARAAYNQSRLS